MIISDSCKNRLVFSASHTKAQSTVYSNSSDKAEISDFTVEMSNLDYSFK